jgi:hypothetical protein
MFTLIRGEVREDFCVRPTTVQVTNCRSEVVKYAKA